jgi:hypothetical protein
VAKNTARDTERRAIAERLRKEQARKERRRSLLIIGSAVVVVVGLLVAALIPYIQARREDSKAAGTPLAKIGATESAADCSPVDKEKATGNNDHVNPPQRIPYPQAPPASGPHWGNFLQGSEIRPFYTVDDRPEIERLVHSLEHGHTILWYDDTVKPGTDAYKNVQAISKKFDETDKFMAAPWTSKDGKSFPDGKHVALTHWTGPQVQEGITQYCAAPSGAVLNTFMDDYPASDAPEPNAP